MKREFQQLVTTTTDPAVVCFLNMFLGFHYRILFYSYMHQRNTKSINGKGEITIRIPKMKKPMERPMMQMVIYSSDE